MMMMMLLLLMMQKQTLVDWIDHVVFVDRFVQCEQQEQ